MPLIGACSGFDSRGVAVSGFSSARVGLVDTRKAALLVKTTEHPFHLVDSSPWPLFTSAAALTFLVGIVLYFHS